MEEEDVFKKRKLGRWDLRSPSPSYLGSDIETISPLFVVFALLLFFFFCLPPCLCALFPCWSACHCVNLKGCFFLPPSSFFLLRPLIKQPLASKTPGYLLPNTFSHKDFPFIQLYKYTCGPILKNRIRPRKSKKRGRQQGRRGQNKIRKGYHGEKFTLVAFQLLITSVGNEIEKMWFPQVDTLTSGHSLHTYLSVICFI